MEAKLSDASKPVTVVPTKEQMDGVIADLTAHADFREAHSTRKVGQ
jgi:hypothetical protein